MPMRLLVTLLLTFGTGLAARAAFAPTWTVGTDNGNQSEFEIEGSAGDNFYLENGNYTALGGIVWTRGREPDSVAVNDGDWDGFERALVPGDPTINIFFQLNAIQADTNAQLRFTVDLISLGGTSSHDLEFRLNNVLLRSLTNVTAARVEVITGSATAFGAQPGPNKFTVTRTGGGSTNPWIQFDYLRLETDPPRLLNSFTTDRATLTPGQTARLAWTCDPAATVQLAPGVGDVTSLTTNGVGAVTVSPSASTTYTLTTTLGPASESATIRLEYNPYTQLWQAGLDNGNTDEMSHEGGGDDDYYFAGDFSPVGGPVLATAETLRDDTTPNVIDGNPALGFERALVPADPLSNIWFILSPSNAQPQVSYRFTMEVLGMSAGSTHNLEFSMNGLGSRTVNAVAAPGLITFVWTGTVVNPVAGPNRVTYQRTGGTAGAYITFDFVRLERQETAIPLGTITTDPRLGTRMIHWNGNPGYTYLVQASPDNLAWTNLATGFPRGGATVAAQFFEDRDTPAAAPQPFYRIFQE